jgi:hypothetical protein
MHCVLFCSLFFFRSTTIIFAIRGEDISIKVIDEFIFATFPYTTSFLVRHTIQFKSNKYTFQERNRIFHEENKHLQYH